MATGVRRLQRPLAPARQRNSVIVAGVGTAWVGSGAIVVGVILAAGCSSTDAVSGNSASTATRPTAVAVPAATWTDGPWPFTVPSGVLRCRFSHQVTFTADGVEYAINSGARRSGHFHDLAGIQPAGEPTGYVEIGGQRQPVSADAPGVTAMLSRGLDLCA